MWAFSPSAQSSVAAVCRKSRKRIDGKSARSGSGRNARRRMLPRSIGVQTFVVTTIFLDDDVSDAGKGDSTCVYC